MASLTLGLGINDPVVFGTSFHGFNERMFTWGKIWSRVVQPEHPGTVLPLPTPCYPEGRGRTN